MSCEGWVRGCYQTEGIHHSKITIFSRPARSELPRVDCSIDDPFEPPDHRYRMNSSANTGMATVAIRSMRFLHARDCPVASARPRYEQQATSGLESCPPLVMHQSRRRVLTLLAPIFLADVSRCGMQSCILWLDMGHR